MPAVALIEAPTEDKVQRAFEIAEAHFGHVPNLVKALGSNPDMCDSITAFFVQAMQDGRVAWAFKELVVLKTLRAIGSYYSYGAHERIAAELGNSPERIGDLNNSLWHTSDHYTDGEKAVFELVDQIAVDANAVSDLLWDKLRTHWNAGQLVELNALITTFVMIGRTGDTLGVAEPFLFAHPVA
jgi:alkylhydroperoxidase family enzyme